MKAKFRPTSCLDYLRRCDTTSGIYKLYDNSGNSFSAYCDLKSEPGIAWTLVMSWSLKNRRLTAFWDKPITYNWPLSENAQNWDQYRLSQKRMKSLQAHSTHWRATCCYPTHGVDFTDYVRGNFKDFNIVDYLDSAKCKKVEYINIREHKGTNLTAPFWQIDNTFLLHIDSTYTHCQFNASPGSVFSEDNFGFYRSFNPKFRCTQGNNSTTQWRFGSHL